MDLGRGRGQRMGPPMQQQQQQPQQQMPQQQGGMDQRRELRRPYNPADDLSRGMSAMDPFGGGGGGQAGGYNVYAGMAQPAPSADGWSSGENHFDAATMGDPYHMHQHNQPRHQGGYNNGRGQYRGRGNSRGRYNNHHNQHHNNYYQQQQQQQQQQNYYPNRSWTGPNNPQQQQQHYQMNDGQQFQQQQAAAAAAAQQQAGGNWNLGASEFVPKAGGLSASACGFVPRQMATNTSQWAYGQQQQQQVYEDPVQTVEMSINKLNFSPGKYEATAAQLTEILNSFVNDLTTMENVVDCIYRKAVTQINFRYTGARLLDHLAATVYVDFEGKTLKSILLEKCLTQHEVTKGLCKTETSKFRNFTAFMADLFVQFGDYEGENKVRSNDLCKAVLELLDIWSEDRPLTKPGIRELSQALRMSGGALEENEKLSTDGKCPVFDALMVKIEAIANHEPMEGMPAYMFELMGSIIELRKNDWGSNSSSSSAADGKVTSVPHTNLAYKGHSGPAGPKNNHQQYVPPHLQPTPAPGESAVPGVAANSPAATATAAKKPAAECELTEEEMKFMNDNIGADDEDTDGENDMPPEIADAYDDFLRESGNNGGGN